MNKDQMEGNWKQLAGVLRTKWGKLTDSDLEIVKGEREQLVGRLQERYGIALERAQQMMKDFADDYSRAAAHPRDVATEGGRLDNDTLKLGM